MFESTGTRRWRRWSALGLVVLAGCAPAAGGCSPESTPSTTVDPTTTVPGESSTTTEPPGSSTTVAGSGSTTTTEPSGPTTTEPTGSTTTLPGSTTTVPGGTTTVRTEDLDVEDCITPTEQSESIGTVTVLDCDAPHQMEVFAQFDVDPGDLPDGSAENGYPGGGELTWFAQDECQKHFERYTGDDYFDSVYDFTTITPSYSTWDAGDRLVTCLVVDADGAVLTGSAKGSNR